MEERVERLRVEKEQELQQLREENQRLKDLLVRLTMSAPSQPHAPVVSPQPQRR